MELLEREAPLAALEAARARAADGKGSIVLVTGEPGIGKTALLTRFVARGPAARFLWGSCDDLKIPPPLGPFRDLSGGSPALREALASDAPAHRVHSAVLELLARPPSPTVLVIEDIHWADEATVDAITVIGRRISDLPALLALTLRPGDIGPDHPVHTALAGARSNTWTYIDLAPLSRAAVEALAPDDAEHLYAVTGGNPFYVTELLAGGAARIPPSVAHAIMARAAHLEDSSRRLVELASVIPGHVDWALLDRVLPDWPTAAEEPERIQLLVTSGRQVRFRHELARQAVSSSIPPARRRGLHKLVLGALLSQDPDPAQVVFHAEEAGADDLVAAYAPVAARRAASLESNREAYAHFRRAVELAHTFEPEVRARLLEELATAAYTVGRTDEALVAIGHAIDLHRRGGNAEDLGRCVRQQSRFHWYRGDGPAAFSSAREAVRILEGLGESVELARAYSGLSQLAMLSSRTKETIEWGTRAIALAERIGDDSTRGHALINLGSVRLGLDPDDAGDLLAGHQIADAAGDRHEAVRALINLAFSLLEWIRPEQAERYAATAVAYADEHQVDTLGAYAKIICAWLQLRRGEWSQAEHAAGAEAEHGSSVTQLLARTVLAELAVRRGDPDAAQMLADLVDRADATGELQRIAPVLQLQTEWALLTEAAVPVDRFDRAMQLLTAMDGPAYGPARTVAASAALAGVDVDIDAPLPPAQAALVGHDWTRAAEEFDEVGWPFERALALSFLDEPDPLLEALEIARRLGADPLVGRVARRLRDLGQPVPRGPLPSTLSNPAGLTRRQHEVLRLLAEGLTNAEIADRMVVSQRTAEHHVAGILTRLGVPTRRDAVARAGELGLLPGPEPSRPSVPADR